MPGFSAFEALRVVPGMAVEALPLLTEKKKSRVKRFATLKLNYHITSLTISEALFIRCSVMAYDCKISHAAIKTYTFQIIFYAL